MKIIGTGSSLPQKVVTNDDLAAIMDTSDEWISSRTGIRKRHIATTETTTSLAVEAVKAALSDAGTDGSEIDLIIAASVTGDKIVPSLACQIQAEIGADSAVAFDINAACSGFLFALATADAYFKTGRFHKAVILGAEVLSKIWIGMIEVRVFFLEMERGLQLFQMKGIRLRLLYRGLTEQVEKHLMQITARY